MAHDLEPDHSTLRKLQLDSARAARWAKETDRTAALAPAHDGRDFSIAVKYGVVNETTTVEEFITRLRTDTALEKRFESARKAHYFDLARRSVAARLKAKKALSEAEAAEAELGDFDDAA